MLTDDALAPVASLGWVAKRTNDVEALVAHYTDALSFEVAARDGATTYLTVNPDHHCLVISEGEPTGRAAVGLRLGGSIDDAETRLRDGGYPVTRQSDPQPGISEALLLVEPGTETPILLYERMDTGSVPAVLAPRPTKLGHVANFAPNLAEARGFYETALGFRWSDQVADFFIFMRCNSDHHAVNVMESMKRTGLHHVAFEARDFIHFKDILDNLAKHEVRLTWGPGRHGPGHNIFSYHLDPDGNTIEVFTEIDQILDERDPHWEPRPWHEEFPMGPKQWPQEAATANQWGPRDLSQIEH